MSAVSSNMSSGTLPAWIAVETLTQRETKAAYSYWLKKRGDRLMPRRTDIDPSEIAPLLACVSIIDVLTEPMSDYFYRIEGEAVRQALGFRRMGYRLSEFKSQMSGGAYESTVERLDMVCTEKRPKAQASSMAMIGRKFCQFDVVSLPLSQDGHQVDRIFQCIGFLKRPG